MSRKIILIIILLLTSFIIFTQEVFPIYFTGSANITIDGSNEDWPASLPCVIESDTQVVLEKRKSPDSFGGKIWCLWVGILRI